MIVMLFQNISTLFYSSFSFKSPSLILLMLSNGPPSSIVLAHRYIFVILLNVKKTPELQLLNKYGCDPSSVIEFVKMKYNLI